MRQIRTCIADGGRMSRKIAIMEYPGLLAEISGRPGEENGVTLSPFILQASTVIS